MSDWPQIKELVALTKSGKSTALDNVQKSLALINQKKQYQSVIQTLEGSAIKRAKEVDELISKGEDPGRLAGVPFIAKDNFLTLEGNTTAASNMLKSFKAPYQSTAVQLLLDEGAILVAKSNLDAFAHGTSTENSDFYVTKNPFDLERVAGGSSGGSAAAVALGLTPFALGTDTGGSIRMPASICGVVGYKPTYGTVSRSGVVAMSSSLDTIGAFANNVDDAALVQEIMTKQDPLDSTTIALEDNNYSENLTLPKKLRIGVIKEYIEGDLNPDIKAEILNIIDKLKSAGHSVDEVSIPDLPLALAVYYIVCPAEVASNLSRYDGIKYGHQASKADNLEEYYLKSRSEGFGQEAKRRIMIGTHVLSSGYFEAYYNKAQTVRTELINQFKDAFSNHDFLIGPTTSDTAFKIGEKTDPLSMYLLDLMTVAPNLVGIPAINIPAGTSKGLPFGVQLMSNQKEDHKLFSFAKTVESLV